MPQDRLRSPRAGHGRRTASLTDLEYRVWDQYQLSADDFGVMRCSALTIQDDNDALAERPREDIQAALERLSEVELCLAFEHQGRRYLCQIDWQTFQKIEYPRVTLLPKPPPEVLSRCEVSTRKLFGKHPGGTPKRSPKISQKSPEGSPKGSLEIAGGSPTTRARVTRETANTNGLRLEAHGQRPIKIGDRFDAFWANYPRKVAKEAARKAFVTMSPDDAVLDQIDTAIAWQRRTPDWRKERGKFVPYPATYLNNKRWLDEPDIGEAVPSFARTDDWICTHTPKCLHPTPCRIKQALEAEKVAS